MKNKIVLADHQNWYPDLTFVNAENNNIKFAVDLKTTFRRNNKSAGFTLGSHGAYNHKEVQALISATIFSNIED